MLDLPPADEFVAELRVVQERLERLAKARLFGWTSRDAAQWEGFVQRERILLDRVALAVRLKAVPPPGRS